jgi:hypothetical protein
MCVCGGPLGVTSNKTHVEHNKSDLTLIADMPGEMNFRSNGPSTTLWAEAVRLLLPRSPKMIKISRHCAPMRCVRGYVGVAEKESRQPWKKANG